MIPRLLLAACLAGLCAGNALSQPAQLALLVVEGDSERLIETQFLVGTAAAGDFLDTRLRVKNVGIASASLSSFSVSGSGFALVAPPPLPQGLAPGGSVDFTVRFQPGSLGSYSANLRADSLSVILRGVAVALATVMVEEAGARQRLTSASVVDFGSVERGSFATRRFILENQTGQLLTIEAIALTGAYFRLAANPPVGVTLAANESLFFDVVFEPLAAGPQQAVLRIDQRRFVLRADGREPPLPKPELVVELPTVASAQQGRLSVRLASPSHSSALGKVQMEFRPAVAGVTSDPAILFPATGGRSALFSISEGDTQARFGSLASIEFQTGTTAGVILFSIELGDLREQLSLTIAPGPVEVEAARASRAGPNLELRVSGFDNSRSVSQLSFTFFDRNGSPIAPGPIRMDSSANFHDYFESSELGGVFALRAIFPVTGNPDQIEAVEFEVTNSAGTVKSQRIHF